MNCQQLFFLRHLPTQNNTHACINGRSADAPILEMRSITGAKDVDVVYCSSALRCRQTLECFSQANKAQSVYESDLLLERSMGRLEGQKRDAMAALYPELFDSNKFRVFSTPPEGEPFEDFMQRVRCFYTDHLALASGDVLVCSHNQFLKALYFLVSNEPIGEKQWKTLNFPLGKMVPIRIFRDQFTDAAEGGFLSDSGRKCQYFNPFFMDQ